MRTLCKEGRLKDAVYILDLMDEQGVRLNSDSYGYVLQCCIKSKALAEGKRVHEHIIRNGLKLNIFLGNNLANMYVKCGSMVAARQVFDQMPKRNVVSWTTLIVGYTQHGHAKEALKLFEQMQQQCVEPDEVTFVSVLNACASLAALEQGKQVHAYIVRVGCEPDVFVGNALVNMYAKCKSLKDARQVFDRMPKRDLVSWNSMIAGYAQNEYGEESLTIFWKMQEEGVKPDIITFVSVLSACSSARDLEHGRQIHTDIIKSGCDSNIFVGNTLVNMYMKCGSIRDAHQVFDKMFKRNVVSWNAIISGYTHYGDGMKALSFFKQMQEEGIRPNKVTFITVLTACALIGDLEVAQQIHASVIENECSLDLLVENALIDMYAKCGSVKHARQVFNKMYRRDVISWNSLISGYAQHGYNEEVFSNFWRMQHEGVKPNQVTFVSVLYACADAEALEQGKQVHAHAIDSQCEADVFVGSALVHMYAKCGSIENARQVFDRMHKRDVVTWTVMIAGYAKHGYCDEALRIFWQMQHEGLKADKVTFISILNACASLAVLELGKHVHAHLITYGYELDLFVGCSLINMYAKCGNIKYARQVFDKMHIRDVVLWNAMIAGYTQHGHGEEALKIFWQMQQDHVMPDKVTFISVLSACTGLAALELGRLVHAHIIYSGDDSDVLVGNTLLDMYAKCGSIEKAFQVFNKMPKQDVVSWSAMIAGYVQHGLATEAFKIFGQMQEANVKPNKVTFISLLNACSGIGSMELGKQIHDHIVKCEFEADFSVGSTLIHMYAKCGNIQHARHVFNRIPKESVVIWTAMITAYAHHRLGEDAIKLFGQMQHEGLKPNLITFTAILTACSQIGLLEEGCYHFDSMTQNYCILPATEHYACMVNLLGRAGCLEEAEDFINKMPFQPGAVVWMALLGASKIHGNVEVAKGAAECILELEPRNTAAFVLLSNIYAGAGKWNDKEMLRKNMRNIEVEK